jgi:dihydrofolate reductase
MGKLTVFNSISLDGYLKDKNNDMSWAAHNQDPEWMEFVSNNTHGNSSMLFGRKTYEMMKSFWTTPQAKEMMPDVADYMNNKPKIVFSRTLKKADWNNTTLFNGNLVEEVTRLKKSGPDFIIFGSGNVTAQLAEAGLIDEYQMVIVPTALGAGGTMFEGLKNHLKLKLKSSRIFKNGNVFLIYEKA